MTLYSSGLLIAYHIQFFKKRRQTQAWKQLKPFGKTVDVTLLKQDSNFPAAVCSLNPLNCFHLERKKKKRTIPDCTAFILCSFVNSYVSCVILREGSKAQALHSHWRASQATKHSEVVYFLWRAKLENHVGASLRWAVRRLSGEHFVSSSAFIFNFLFNYEL